MLELVLVDAPREHVRVQRIHESIGFRVVADQCFVHDLAVAIIRHRTGLPPVHLAEVNFEAFYSQKMAALAQQQSPAGPNGSGAVAKA